MRRLLAFVALFFLWQGAAQAQFYVSPAGLDTNNGTSPSTPFLTLGKCQTSMQTGTKKCFVMAGTYTLAANFSLTSSDAGEVWASYGGNQSIISGGASPASTNKFITITGNNITFEGLTFTNLGDNTGNNGSIYFPSGSTGMVFRWNTITNCQAACIGIGGGGSATIDSNVFNNMLNDVNPGVAIVMFSAASNITVSHNLIENSQGMGIKDQTGPAGAGNNNNVYDGNILINICTAFSDCGALYMMDRTFTGTGGKIINNIVLSVGNGTHTDSSKCVYLDDQASNVTVSGNLCFNDPGQYGIQYHGGSNNLVTNNVFVMASGGTMAVYQGCQFNCNTNGTNNMTGNTFQNNVAEYAGTIPGSNWSLPSPAAPTNPSVSGNLYYSVTGGLVPNGGSVVDSSPVFCGPGSAPGPGPIGNNVYGMPAPNLLAPGAIAAWQSLVANAGPLTRGCSSF